jgi:hypothetical protein
VQRALAAVGGTWLALRVTKLLGTAHTTKQSGATRNPKLTQAGSNISPEGGKRLAFLRVQQSDSKLKLMRSSKRARMHCKDDLARVASMLRQ